MKTLLRTHSYLALIPILLACGLIVAYAQKHSNATEQTSKEKGHVELSIKIHPTIKLSPDDERELRKQLARFDTTLYRLVVLTDGREDREKSIGDLQISDELKKEMGSAQKRGASAFAPEFVPCQGVAFARNKDQAGELIEAITPILKKYQ